MARSMQRYKTLISCRFNPTWQ